MILLGDEDPTYTPKTTRKCGLFELSLRTFQTTIEFGGHDLEGDLLLTIGGSAEIRIDSKATTAQLRAALQAGGISAQECRATVFRGMWEFIFEGRLASESTRVTAEAWQPPEDDTISPYFSGTLTVVDEAWRSVSTDGDTVATVDTQDWIPHAKGAVRAGAIGAAVWCWEAGWLVLAWQCRDFSFSGGGY